MTTAQVVETSVTNNSVPKDYPHPEDHAKQITDTSRFKPFTIVMYACDMQGDLQSALQVAEQNTFLFISEVLDVMCTEPQIPGPMCAEKVIDSVLPMDQKENTDKVCGLRGTAHISFAIVQCNVLGDSNLFFVGAQVINWV